jgi:hypothetical protein
VIGLTDYRRQLVLYALRATRAIDAASARTSSELADVMIGLAQAEGHSEACWRGIAPAHAAGHLRQLEVEGIVQRGPSRANSRAGRQDPSWFVVDPSAATAMPTPPSADDPPADFDLTPPDPPPATPYDDMTREQLAELLAVQDEVLAEVGEFMTRMREVSKRGRERLAKADLL